MPTAKEGQPVNSNNFGQTAVHQLAHDLERFSAVLRTLELRRMGLGSVATDENTMAGIASDEDVLEYFASVDAVYDQMETETEAPNSMCDHAHAKPLPGTRLRSSARRTSKKSVKTIIR